jgi:hypothetical protein
VQKVAYLCMIVYSENRINIETVRASAQGLCFPF